ncbi:MAG: tetratricopeptide repeat protein, partial [Clostridia bacterium]|nr:tetratricopeptide repeat protein [Clostridia bacterium]
AFPVFEIKELDTEKELLPLFGNICPYESEETDTIHNIIDTVHSHTLTVCLSALSMSASGISPSDLLDELKSCGTDIASGEDVELYKDCEFSEVLMIEHLKKLLRITNLAEEQQYILCNLSLMPASGIWKNPFGKWLRLASLTDINRLIKYGFISEDTERRTISLHPLIQEIAEKETQPTISSCRTLNHIIVDDAEEYLHFLQDLFPYFEKYKADEQLKKLTERIEYIMNEFHIATPCDRSLLLDYKAELLLEDGKPEKALKKRKRAIEIMEKEYSHTIDRRTVSLLSNLYNNIGATYSVLHKKDDAIAALEKAFLIRIEHKELNLIETHDILQQMMNTTRLMLVEDRTSDAENILSTYEMIVTERLGTDSLDFGICSLTHGIIAMQQSKTENAEQAFLEAERIFQHKVPQSNDYLESVRQYLYALYKRAGKYSLADSYKLKLIKV